VTGARVFQALKPRNWLVEAVVLIVLVLISWSAISGWRSADTANVFPEALSTIPTVKPGTGFVSLTASSLMRSQPGQRIINVHVDYVSATTRSSGPFVVSVHPINSSTWAAVALGNDGHCYGMVVSETNTDDETYYARFPIHTPCLGEEANPATVRSTDYPS
jgi:hypothetical protein